MINGRILLITMYEYIYNNNENINRNMKVNNIMTLYICSITLRLYYNNIIYHYGQNEDIEFVPVYMMMITARFSVCRRGVSLSESWKVS